MHRQGVKVLLEYLGADTLSDSDEWVRTSCLFAPWLHAHPEDPKRSMGVSAESGGFSTVRCFNCGEHGGLLEAVQKLRQLGFVPLGSWEDIATLIVKETEDFTVESPKLDIKPDQVIPFPEEYLNGFWHPYHQKEGYLYLKSRGIDMKMIDELDIRWDPLEKRVCFPIRDAQQRLVGLRGRAVNKDVDLPYKAYRWNKIYNPQVWYGEEWVDPDHPVVLTEGIFDALSVYRVYKNVMSPLSAAVSKKRLDHNLSAFVSGIIIMFDSDIGGQKGAQMIMNHFNDRPICNVVLDKGKDPGDYGPEQILDIIMACDTVLFPLLTVDPSLGTKGD